MKFNEKLIELRKKEGLSQEELGYKLNVTRQTVSKWELGQTTPEMDKLVEMGKIFNVSVDELINESEVTTNENPVIEDQPIKEKETKNNKIVIIIVGAIILITILIGIGIFNGISNFFNGVTGKISNLANDVTEESKQITEESEGFFGKIFSMFNKSIDSQMVDSFNGSFELLSGTQMGVMTSEVLDKIITNNKTEDRKITVKFMEQETSDPNEIKSMKQKIGTHDNYEISYEYDEEGFINEAIIEKVNNETESILDTVNNAISMSESIIGGAESSIDEYDIKSFNNSFEIYAGSKMGGTVIHVLDEIITNNKTEDRKITVKYLATETQDEAQIRNIKQSIGTFDNYEIIYDYDADGFINKATIEKY